MNGETHHNNELRKEDIPPHLGIHDPDRRVENNGDLVLIKDAIDPDKRIENEAEEHSDVLPVSDTKDESADQTDICKNVDDIHEEKITRVIETQNQSLEGEQHPITGVRFERKTVELQDEYVEGVFPVFDSKYDAQLPPDKYKASSYVQFKECTSQLKDAIDKNPELAKQFTETQLEQIKNGEPRIKGYIWHHNEELGKMQLVDAKTHEQTSHTGGNDLWGNKS